jgi:hypothetical protein
MEAARTSEASVDIQLRTRQYIPEDSELQKKGLLAILIGNPQRKATTSDILGIVG